MAKPRDGMRHKRPESVADDRQADLATYEAEIKKTGFVLENVIAQKLKSAGWTVISNRYYVDDAEEKVREIDLVAYRSTMIQNQRVRVITSLLISCKKDQDNAWALLARDLDLKDPNSDWWPLHAWTNDLAIQYELGLKGVARKYHDDADLAGVKEALQLPSAEVFAFQLMKRSNGAPQNDRPIFDALTGLMKAQSYELTALPERRKGPELRVYQFNLLAVAETKMIRLHLNHDEVAATEITSEHYIARYIVQKKETVSRIRFVQANHFEECLDDYARLHASNCKWFVDKRAHFYSMAIRDPFRTEVLVKRFRVALTWYLEHLIKRGTGTEASLKELSVEWREDKQAVAVTEWFTSDVIQFLNGDADSRERAAKSLKEVFMYEGAFFFDTPEIPF